MSGWIKIHRKFEKWEWRDKPEMVSLFLHMLTQANYEPSKWHGITILRGQCIYGRLKWAETLGISEQRLRTCLERLKSTSEVTIESTSQFSVITIVNYEEYQQDESEPTSESTSDFQNEQPAINQRSTTPKELKNLRKKETPLVPKQEKFELKEPSSPKPDRFDEFYEIYPPSKSRSKEDARKAWTKATATYSPETIIEAARIYSEQRAAEPEEDRVKFTPMASTWLNKKRFLDLDDDGEFNQSDPHTAYL